MEQVFEDEQIKHLQMVHEVNKDGKDYKLVRSPIRSSDNNIISPQPPPNNGEHTD